MPRALAKELHGLCDADANSLLGKKYLVLFSSLSQWTVQTS